LGTEKKAGGIGVFSRTACSSEQEAFIGVSAPPHRRSTKGEMGEISFATKSRSLIPHRCKRLLLEGPT
jgi:hypothetical protein